MNFFQKLTELNVHHLHVSHHLSAVIVFFFLKFSLQWTLPLVYSDIALITAVSILLNLLMSRCAALSTIFLRVLSSLRYASNYN